MRRERRQQGVLNVIDHHVESLELSGAALCQGDHVATAINGIGVAPGESTRDQVVQGGNDVASVDTSLPSELRLAGRTELIERGEQSEVIAADPLGRKAICQQRLGAVAGAAQQPRRPARDPLRVLTSG